MEKAKRNKEKPNSNQLAYSVSICHQHYNLIIDNNYSAGPSCFEGRLALTQAIYLFILFIFYFFQSRFLYFFFQKPVRKIFPFFLEHPIIKLRAKRFELNFLLKNGCLAFCQCFRGGDKRDERKLNCEEHKTWY